MKKERLYIYLLLMFCLNLAVTFPLIAQNFKISGTVVEQGTGEPIGGASIAIKGTSSGTITNIDGEYQLSLANGNQTLIVSYIGLKTQEVAVNGATKLNITLDKETTNIDEVVVTALGISRDKKALGYSVQEVKGEEMTKIRQTNAVSALSGKVAGMQVTSYGGAMGGSANVNIRGVSSLTGSNQPLFVVDGVPIDNANVNQSGVEKGYAGRDFGNLAQDINPDDIASVSVLKGPSAATLYGSRAANGVILITTKRGKTGAAKFSLSVNSGTEIETVRPFLAKMQQEYGGGAGDTFEQVDIDGNTYSVVNYAWDESWGPKYDGQMVLHWDALDSEFEDEYLQTREWKYPENDIKEYFDYGVALTNNISLESSSKESTMRLSYTNKYVKGQTPNADLKRNTLSVNGTRDWNDFNFFYTLNYVGSNAKGRAWQGTTNRNVILQAYQWGQTQVDYKRQQAYERADGSQRLWNRTAWNDSAPKYIDNPYWSAYKSYSNDERNRGYGNVGISYKIDDNNTLKGKVGGDIYTFSYEDRIAYGSRSQSSYTESITRFSEFNYELMLNGKADLTDDLSINYLAGGNIMDQSRFENVEATQGGLSIPELYNISNSVSTPLVSDATYNKRIYSFYGNVSFGWKSMVFLDGTFRNDISSTLNSDNNSYFYPAVTAGFIFSELSAFDDIDWLDFGKVRASWAQVGNDTDPYALTKTYESSTNFGDNVMYGIPDEITNSDLKAELTSSWEFGLTLNMFNNRVVFDGTYYDTTSENQIIPLPIANSSGYQSKIINAGAISNKGIEISLDAAVIAKKAFKWNVGVNWAKNNNKVEELIEGIETLELSDSFIDLHAYVGSTYGVLLGSNFVFDEDGNKLIGADGLYAQTEQLEDLGSVLPDWNMGLKNSFSYKGFDLGILLDARVGGDYYSQTYKYGTYSGILEHTAENNIREDGLILDGVNGNVTFNSDGSYDVTVTGDNTTRVTGQEWAKGYSSGPIAQSIFDATYIKLREMTLAYSIPLNSSSAIKKLNLSLYGRNLAFIYRDNKVIDPEFSFSSGNVQGIEGAATPNPLTVGLNVGIKF